MKYHIITYGCQMNKSDSERIASALNKIGYKQASQVNKADLVVVNMCSVRQSAVDRVIGKINNFSKFKLKNENCKFLLTGCISKKDKKKFEKYFDYILPVKTLHYWKDFLKEKKCFYYPPPRDSIFCKKFKDEYLDLKPDYSNKFSVLVPISVGCNNFCTFCAVPFVRGPEINRNHKKILKEVKGAVKNGAKEIWLLGQNVNSYKSKNINFALLLKLINKIPGNFWVRFTSPHPKYFSDELIETMKSCEKITNYLNLPVQAGDDIILKKMNRPYTVKYYKNLVKKIRNIMPDICLSTDVIVGFPGETKKQFKNTCKLFKEMKFDMAYVSEYSPRQQTLAGKMKDNVSKKEKTKRKEIINEIIKKTGLENNRKYIGETIEVLVEKEKNGLFTGKSKSYKTIIFQANKKLLGKFVKIKILEATSWSLKGKLKND